MLFDILPTFALVLFLLIKKLSCLLFCVEDMRYSINIRNSTLCPIATLVGSFQVKDLEDFHPDKASSKTPAVLTISIVILTCLAAAVPLTVVSTRSPQPATCHHPLPRGYAHPPTPDFLAELLLELLLKMSQLS